MTVTEFERAAGMTPQSATPQVWIRFAGLVFASAAALAIVVTAGLAAGAALLSKLTP